MILLARKTGTCRDGSFVGEMNIFLANALNESGAFGVDVHEGGFEQAPVNKSKLFRNYY